MKNLLCLLFQSLSICAYSQNSINVKDEIKLIDYIKKLKSFPKDKKYDTHFVVYSGYIKEVNWSLESFKDNSVFENLIFEKKLVKSGLCKKFDLVECEVYFVNTMANNKYFFSDGFLFYSKHNHLDSTLVNNLMKERGQMFINISNLESTIYLIVNKGKIVKIFDQKLGKVFDAGFYYSNYPNNLKIAESFKWLYK